MNKRIVSTFFAMAVVCFFTACSFTTANISSFTFGKNETATPAATSFDMADKVYAVAVVANAMGKYKMKFKLTMENPPAGAKAEPMTKDIDFDGSRSVWLTFSPGAPGTYKAEAVLTDESGKEIDKKSGTFTVKGEAPKPAAAPADSNSNTEEDAEDSKADNK